jgi:hypothetical protein
MQFIAECGIEYGCQFVTLFFFNPPDSLYTKKAENSYKVTKTLERKGITFEIIHNLRI